MVWGNRGSFSFLQTLGDKEHGAMGHRRNGKKQEERESVWKGGGRSGNGPRHRRGQTVLVLCPAATAPHRSMSFAPHCPCSSLLWLRSLFQDLSCSRFHLSLKGLFFLLPQQALWVVSAGNECKDRSQIIYVVRRYSWDVNSASLARELVYLATAHHSQSEVPKSAASASPAHCPNSSCNWLVLQVSTQRSSL